MSSPDPQRPRSRRRIAGERRQRSSDVEATSEPEAVHAGEPQPEPTLEPHPRPTGEEGPVPSPRPEGADRPDPERAGPSWLVIGLLGALALVLVSTAAVLGLVVWDVGEVREHEDVQQAARVAPAAAERASAAILSYEYTSLDADARAARRYMTPKYRKEYDDSFQRLVRPNAPRLRAKVQAEVKASGVSNADPDRVDVLVYVNQTTTSTANGGEPQIALNRVRVSMVRQGGSWLVNDLTSY